MSTKTTEDTYARIRMPWARKGPRFLSPSYHRIAPDMRMRTRCGMPIRGTVVEYSWGSLVNAAHPFAPKVCRTCDYMAGVR